MPTGDKILVRLGDSYSNNTVYVYQKMPIIRKVVKLVVFAYALKWLRIKCFQK